MTSGRRKSKKARREEFVRTSAARQADKAGKKAWHDLYGGRCINGCGQKGPHFIPPSLGDPGFFICTPIKSEERRDGEDPQAA